MRIRNFTGLLLLLSLSFTLSHAQSVTGLWLGVSYPGNPNQNVYDYTMTFTQTGSRLDGTAQSATPNLPFSGLVRVSGQLTGSTVQFNESDQSGSTAVRSICYWRGTLAYNSTDESLIGTYENIVNGTTCFNALSGKVELYRIALTSDTTFCKGKPVNLAITGKNIRWYASASKTGLLATGNTFSPNITQTTTFYITQTLYQNESPAIPITITISDPVIRIVSANTGCDKTNGAIEVAASGSTGWQYSLNGGGFQPNPLFASLVPGSYTVVARDTYGCQAGQAVTITGDAAPTIPNLFVTPPKCASANGEVSVVAAGGKAPLTYSIDYGVTFQSSSVFNKLAGGSYTIRVRDANGCEVNKAVTLPPFIPMEIQNVSLSSTTCGLPNGEVTMNISGGYKPVRYSIDNQTVKNDPHFTDLTAGAYTIQAKDSTGCTISRSVTIAASTGPQISDIQTTIATCGEQNGTIYILLPATAPALVFSIDGQSFQRNPVFLGLKAGNYTLTIQDDNACLSTKPVQISLDCGNQVYLPTAFSPNHDLVNDAFIVHFGFPSLTITTFIVYDRWGAVVYNRANFALSSGEPLWDGQLNGGAAPAGMYGYRLDCLFPDGTPMTYRQSVALLH
ncbi:T9SS type B sorting domain-containing protein [Spirosoma pollinicola]|uniref:Ig-like domain-containing protein n=1 Tax=Spirosoma pollinicola TaxID=2057025 RepID=A0A2K8Z4U8_9BACT|nr:gliding motility-associated C-terminal domain-containing protein [Spirosoma pollinicola]AUD04903.1 hypothetical protein CWM47_25495 [Spirosoma pollinicola]